MIKGSIHQENIKNINAYAPNKRAPNYMKKGLQQGFLLSPVYLTYMQSTSWEMPGLMSYKLESRLPGEIATTSDMQMIPP